MIEIDHILAVIEDTGFVATDTRHGTTVYRAAVCSPYRVTVTPWDGATEAFEATAHRTLAQNLAGLRAATPEEIADYKRLERPAPQNWY